MVEETQQSLWNFDGAELFVMFQQKIEFIEALKEWDLETAYWRIRDLRRELDAKLDKNKKKFKGIELEEYKKKERKIFSEKEKVDSLLNNLEGVRKKFNLIENPSQEDKGTFYTELEEFYLHLCSLMKKHGLYFREGEDSRMAVLRR